MKIYTKRGDKGETSLIGGARVPKYDDKVEAYGTIDELNSHIGLIYDLCEENSLSTLLLEIQERLFVAESRVACNSEEILNKLPQLYDEDIEALETAIDEMNSKLPELKNFILPSGHFIASHTHIARTVCRRAERITIKALKDTNSETRVLKYLNRLSDYLFVLARYFAYELGNGDVIWKAKTTEK